MFFYNTCKESRDILVTCGGCTLGNNSWNSIQAWIMDFSPQMASLGFSDILHPLCNSKWVQSRELRCLWRYCVHQGWDLVRGLSAGLCSNDSRFTQKIADMKFNLVFRDAYGNYASQLGSSPMGVVTEVQPNDARGTAVYTGTSAFAPWTISLAEFYVMCTVLVLDLPHYYFFSFPFGTPNDTQWWLKNRNCWAFILCANTCP